MAIFYQVTKSMSTTALPPGADAVERGADDRPLLMGCAVPRMQRPGPPDARRMPLSADGTGAWIPPASGRNPRPLMRRM